MTHPFPSFLADVSVKIAAVPAGLDLVNAEGVLWRAARGRFLFEVPEVARYLVENGSSVTIEPAAGGDEEAIFRFLRMTPTAALLFQRGVLALHAAAVSNGAGAVLLAGDSGAGKSSLAAALALRGWSLLSDDLAAVGLNPAGEPVVRPTFPDLALWPDSLNKLGIDSAGLPRLDANRLSLSVPQRFSKDSLPLRAVYFLSVHNKEDLRRGEPAGAERFRAMGKRLYNSRIADALLDKGAYMRIAAAIAQRCRIIRLTRPRGAWCVEELADVIEQEQP